MDINCTYHCLYQIDGKCCLTDTPKDFKSSASGAAGVMPYVLNYGALAHYDGDCPYRTMSSFGTFRSAMLQFT